MPKRKRSESLAVDLTTDSDRDFSEDIDDSLFDGPVNDTDQEEAEISNLVDGHVDTYTDIHPTVRPLFTTLITDVVTVSTKAPTFSTLSDIECPGNGLDTNEVHITHWPPKQPGLHASASILTNRVNPTLKWSREAFLNYDNALAYDLIPQREFLNDRVTGQRRQIHELYTQRDDHGAFLDFAESLVRELRCTTREGNIFVYGCHVKAWFMGVFDSGDSIKIQGHTWNIHYIPHPEWIRRWADKSQKAETARKIMKIGQDHSVQVGVEFLNKMIAGELSSATAGEPSNEDDHMDVLLDGEVETAVSVPSQEYLQEIRKAKQRARNRLRIKDKRKSGRLQPYWTIFDAHGLIWTNYITGVVDYYRVHRTEGKEINIKTGKKGSWIHIFLNEMVKILTPEEYKQLQREIVAHTNTPEARRKTQQTMLNNDYRRPRWGETSVIDMDNCIKCHLCDLSYIDLSAIYMHWYQCHKGLEYNPSKFILVGDKESVWACYRCEITFRSKENLKAHIQNSHKLKFDDELVVRKLIPRKPFDQTPRMLGDQAPAILKKRDNPGGQVDILWPCYFEDCKNLSYDKEKLEAHVRQSHVKKGMGKWNLKLALEKSYEFTLKYKLTYFVCYMPQCNDVAFRNLDLAISHCNRQHQSAPTDPSRLIQIPGDGDEDFVVFDGTSREVLDDYRHNTYTPAIQSKSTDPNRARTKIGKACRRCNKNHLPCDGGRPCIQCSSRELDCEDQQDEKPQKKSSTAKEPKAKKSKAK